MLMQMELRVNNNNQGEDFSSSTWPLSADQNIRPKRDFRFQVIQVRQCPKWFVWPSRNGGDKTAASSSSQGENDENQNLPAKTEEAKLTTATTQNGFGSMRRSFSRVDASSSTEETNATPTRRCSVKEEKAATVPLPIVAASQPSPTFKILSVSKKWESFDATDEELDDSMTGRLSSSLTMADPRHSH